MATSSRLASNSDTDASPALLTVKLTRTSDPNVVYPGHEKTVHTNQYFNFQTS